MSLQMQLVRKRAAEGFGFNVLPDGWDAELGPPPVWVPVVRTTTNAPGVWQAQIPSLIAGGLQTIRDIWAPVGTSQAAYGSRYAAGQNQQQYPLPPSGYRYDSSGRLVAIAANNVMDFITENPILVGGAVLGVVLLFLKPPGRR